MRDATDNPMVEQQWSGGGAIVATIAPREAAPQ